MYGAIIVAVDESDRSARTVGSAAALAALLDCRLTIVHVRSERGAVPWLDALVTAAAWPRTEPLVLDGEPAAELLRLQEEHADELLCMSTASHTTVGGRIFGTTAASVLAAASRPLLIFGPGAKPLTNVKRVLGCLQGSQDAETVAPLAGMWAFRFGAALELVRAGSAVTPVSPIDLGGDLNAAARRLRAGLGVHASWDVLHSEPAGAALVDRATSDGSDVIVVGHPAGPFDGTFFHLLQHAPTCVLVAGRQRSVDVGPFGPTTADGARAG